MYLVDTNVWLERLLNQEKADEVRAFFDLIPTDRLFMTDFTFHSICVILHRLKRLDSLSIFVDDVFEQGGVELLHLAPSDTNEILDAMNRYGLDFDDAYQYTATGKFGLSLVSFDGDFDRTLTKRMTPSEIVRNPNQ